VLLQRMRALYAAEVTMTDRWLGVFLDPLRALRLERETVVVLVSDHGFYLGDTA
jgi:arylsulfatase A-like enzyme